MFLYVILLFAFSLSNMVLSHLIKTFMNSLVCESAHFIWTLPHGRISTLPECNCGAGLHTPSNHQTRNPSGHNLEHFLVSGCYSWVLLWIWRCCWWQRTGWVTGVSVSLSTYLSLVLSYFSVFRLIFSYQFVASAWFSLFSALKREYFLLRWEVWCQ